LQTALRVTYFVNQSTLGIMAIDAALQQPSLADIPESKLVRSLLADPHWQQRIIGIHGIPDDARAFPEVPLDGLERKGDIDILLADPLHPEFATVVQVKRIKVKAETFASGTPNRLDAFNELKKQTNLLADLGFAQVFAFAMVVVDSRTRNNGEYRFDGLTPALRDTIASSLSLDGFAERIGAMHYEFVQPLDDAPLTSGTYSGKPLRMPQVARQPDAVTAWVAQVVEERIAGGNG
jgi:hypothetical protein